MRGEHLYNKSPRGRLPDGVNHSISARVVVGGRTKRAQFVMIRSDERAYEKSYEKGNKRPSVHAMSTRRISAGAVKIDNSGYVAARTTNHAFFNSPHKHRILSTGKFRDLLTIFIVDTFSRPKWDRMYTIRIGLINIFTGHLAPPRQACRQREKNRNS